MTSRENHELVSIEQFAPVPHGGAQYPLEYIESHGVLKLRETAELVDIGACEETPEPIIEELRVFHRKRIAFHCIDRSELSAFLGRRLASAPGEIEATTDTEEELLLDRLANDAPIVNLVNSLLIEGIRCDASDVHIESFPTGAVVRYRIDGALRNMGTIARDQSTAVSSRIKIMANLNIMERRLPQDGRISVHLGGKPFDLRVSIVPIAHGESIVLRLFQRSGILMRLDDLGLDGVQLDVLRSIAARPHGLVLVTGPTGSGKTTTLTAVLQEVRSEERKIITIEDPVEYALEGINQIPTNDQIGLTFGSLLKRVLRQDPDIIMVGEIRDTETAELAVRAALTGHLVLTTLHTNDAVSAISRLKNMGIEPYLIGGVLRGVMAQRLVRRVCEDCAQPHDATPSEQRLLLRHGLDAGGLRLGAGCKGCVGSGFRGRIAITEIFAVDSEMEGLIADDAPEAEIWSLLRRRGYRPLLVDGYHRAAAGSTSIAEVKRVA